MLGDLRGKGKNEPKIALVFACGNIMRGPGEANATDPQAASEKVGAAMRAAYTDPSVKAIVVRVDSRGGSAVASDSIRRELEKARSLGLPVVVSMGAYAASGGYYIATGADKIVAQPGTITGSIGAFFGKLNLQKLFDKIGVDVDEIAIGKDANFMNPALPLSDSQRIKAEKSGRQVYDDFVALVGAARNLSAEEVDALARGRVWTGAQAHSLKLVDVLGGLNTAHVLAAKLSGAGDDKIPIPELVEYPKPLSLAEKFAMLLGGRQKEGFATVSYQGISDDRDAGFFASILSQVLLASGSSDVMAALREFAQMGVEIRRMRQLMQLSQSPSVSLHYDD